MCFAYYSKKKCPFRDWTYPSTRSQPTLWTLTETAGPPHKPSRPRLDSSNRRSELATCEPQENIWLENFLFRSQGQFLQTLRRGLPLVKWYVHFAIGQTYQWYVHNWSGTIVIEPSQIYELSQKFYEEIGLRLVALPPLFFSRVRTFCRLTVDDEFLRKRLKSIQIDEEIIANYSSNLQVKRQQRI